MKKITLSKTLCLFCVAIFSSFTVLAQNTVLNFDGTSGTISATRSGQQVYTAPMIPLTSSFTIMGWIKTTDTATTQYIFSWGGPTINNYISLELISGKIKFFVPSIITLQSTTATDGTWHHIAVTNNSGATTLYINGLSEDSANVADYSSLAVTETSFGTGFFNNLYQKGFDGDIDEFSIWSVALTSTEINTYKNAPPVGTETDLVAAYNFNPAGATPAGDNTTGFDTLQDLTGNYLGTLFGFPLNGASGNYILSDNAVLNVPNVSSNNSKLVVSPNPTTKSLYISGLETNANYTIYNILGAKMLMDTINVTKTIDVQDLKSGVYILKLSTGQVMKFIKN